MQVSKELELRSYDNRNQWQFRGSAGYSGFFAPVFDYYFDPETEVHWLVYENNGWGGYGCVGYKPTNEELEEAIERMETTPW